MEQTLVCGDGWVTARLPDEAHVVPAGISLALPPVPDLRTAVADALGAPLDLPPLKELARGAGRVTVAFDDPTVPCYAPLWSTAIPLVLAELERGGVRRDRITLVCANALHRQFTPDELARILGPEMVREFAA